VAVAARALLSIAREHDLILTHGNGPQVGLLALQNAAYHAEEQYTLDVLDAETEGVIGYLLEQELWNLRVPVPHRGGRPDHCERGAATALERLVPSRVLRPPFRRSLG